MHGAIAPRLTPSVDSKPIRPYFHTMPFSRYKRHSFSILLIHGDVDGRDSTHAGFCSIGNLGCSPLSSKHPDPKTGVFTNVE